MLDFMARGTYQDPQGYTWTFFGDDDDVNVFYIIPQPQLVLNAQGQPQISLVQYQTDGADNGAGYCQATVELAVPQNIIDTIKQKLPPVLPRATQPRYQALETNPGAMAYLEFSDGTSTTFYSAPASSYGGNVATFILHLPPTQMKALVATMSGSGGSYPLQYKISVPASLQAVSAVLKFDSSLAYQYQVTQPSYNGWGHETSPGYVTKTLQESGSSTVNIKWGVAQPTADQEQTVTDWANNTLAALVQAEVKEAIAVENQSSYQSFTINNVASFTNTYNENQIIDWVLTPQAILPTLGTGIGKFLSKVNQRKQTMTVVAQLPFEGEPGSPGVTGFTPAAVVSVTVTVKYPGLTQANATATFTSSGTVRSHTFVCDYDTTQGPNWSVEYTVNFKGGATVTGTATTDQALYTLQPVQAGFLAVKFDATNAYSGIGAAPDSIDVNLTFMATGPTAQPFNQTLTLNKSTLTGTISSTQAYAIDQPYNFTVTYNYPGDPAYSAPTQRRQTGFYQQIGPAAGLSETVVYLAYQPNSNDAPIVGAQVKLWYGETLNIPGMQSQPTSDDPQLVNLTPQTLGSSGYVFASEVFLGFPLGRSPLYYSASINSLGGQIDIDAQPVANTQPSIIASPIQRYFTVEISPADINWRSASYKQVQVVIELLPVKGGGSSQSNVPTAFTWNAGDSDPAYITYAYTVTPGSPAPTLQYSWTASYITPGQNAVTTQPATGETPLLNIPAVPPS